MPGINFPSSPTVGQTVTVGSYKWTWDGLSWTAEGGNIGPTGPTGPEGSVNKAIAMTIIFGN